MIIGLTSAVFSYPYVHGRFVLRHKYSQQVSIIIINNHFVNNLFTTFFQNEKHTPIKSRVSEDQAKFGVKLGIDYTGYATATLNGVNTGKLIFEGNLVPLETTSVFKGMAR